MIIKKELLFTVDEENNPITPMPRDKVHAEGMWHRTSHVWVYSQDKQILCQKRSLLKDSSPGLWEPFFGGHVAPDREYLEVAIQELKEELGISATKEDLKLFEVFKNFKEKEFEAIFGYTWNGNVSALVLEKEEVDEIAWRTYPELQKICKAKDPKWTHIVYEQKVIDWIVGL